MTRQRCQRWCRLRPRPLLILALLAHRGSHGFTYRSQDLKLVAPERICISGVQHRTSKSSTLLGDVTGQPCPTTAEEVANYDAIVMDEHGFVKITLKDIRMGDDGRQRVHRDVTDDAYYIARDVGSGGGGGIGGGGAIGRLWNNLFGRRNHHLNHGRSLANDGDKDKEEGNEETDHKIDQELVPEATSDAVLQSSATPHHLQIYLVPLDDLLDSDDLVTKSQCCYELEFGPPFPPWVETERVNGQERAVLPAECALKNRPDDNINNKNNGDDTIAGTGSMPSSYAHDYRVNAPRTGNMQATTAPIIVNAEAQPMPPVDNTKVGKRKRKKENNKLEPGVHLVKTLRPEKLGRHMIVISNCAAELEMLPQKRDRYARLLADGSTNVTAMSASATATATANTSTRPQPRFRAVGLKAVVSEVEISFVSKFGELPLSMSGIIPFYGTLLACYAILTAVWWKRSMAPHPVAEKGKGNRWGHSSHGIRDAFGGIMSGISGDFASVSPRPVLGLQRVLRNLIHLQLLFTAIAFAYYLHLNRTTVDVDVLYSGTAAALVDWGPWSMAVATAHFCTILGSQVVVTLATDGTWLIQQNIRPDTKKVLYGLAGVWFAFFLMYGFLTPKSRGMLLMILGVAWVGFLLYNVRRSLRHLRMLMVGQDNDNVIAVGGALVAKRSLYKKMCAVIAIYPVVFLVSLIWSSNSQQDSWTWVSYVLIDVYLFIILLHASIIWMPRPMASQEYVKYAPLEVSVTPNNDEDLWEEGIQETWSEEEVEMVFQ